MKIIIIFLATIMLFAGIATAQVDSTAMTQQLSSELGVLDLKVIALQTLKNYYNTHSDTVIITVPVLGGFMSPTIPLKFKTNADFRQTNNDSLQSLKAQKQAVKAAIKAWQGNAKDK